MEGRGRSGVRYLHRDIPGRAHWLRRFAVVGVDGEREPDDVVLGIRLSDLEGKQIGSRRSRSRYNPQDRTSVARWVSELR